MECFVDMSFKPFPTQLKHKALYHNGIAIFSHELSIDIVLELYNSRRPIKLIHLFYTHKVCKSSYYAILRMLCYFNVITKKGHFYYLNAWQREFASDLIQLVFRLGINSKRKLC